MTDTFFIRLRNKFGDWPIGQKITAMVLLISGACVLISYLIFASILVYRDYRMLKDSMWQLSEMIADNSQAALAFRDSDDATLILSSLIHNPSIRSAHICLPDKSIFASFRPHLDMDKIHDTERVGVYVIRDTLKTVRPIELEGEVLGYLVINTNFSQIQKSIQSIFLIGVMVVLLAMVMAYTFTKRLQLFITRPIRRVAGTARYIAESKDYTARENYPNKDEVGDLIKAFNAMLETVQVHEQRLESSRQDLFQAERIAQMGHWEWSPGGRLTLSPGARSILMIKSDEQQKALENEQFHKLIEQIAQTSNHHSKDIRFTLADETEVICHIMGYAKESNGQLTTVFGTLQDVTIIKEIESALREAKQKAESANSAKSEFLAVISHELRTPLNPIVGMSHLLVTEVENKEHKEMLEVITNSANHLLNLIEDILNYIKAEAGKLQYDEMEVDVNGLVISIINLYKKQTEGTQVKLVYTIDEKSPKSLLLDPKPLRQILINLVSNALKFTENGSVSLHVYPTEGNRVCFQVKDTGIGIPKSKQKVIFEPFMQVDSGTTRRYGGTGLGLSICRQLSQILGGSVQCDSEVSVGSSFTLTLPVKQVVDKQNVTGLDPVEYSKDKEYKTLIVDDSATNRLTLQSILKHMGHKVDQADDPYQALHKIRERTYDLLFLDIHMAPIDGLELFQQIKKGLPTEKVPICIAYSADVKENLRQKCLDAGMLYYLTKPVTEKDVHSAIMQIMG